MPASTDSSVSVPWLDSDSDRPSTSFQSTWNSSARRRVIRLPVPRTASR